MIIKSTNLVFVILLLSCQADIEGIQNVSFEKDIHPILKENCVLCHSAHAKLGNINLESYAAMMASRYLNRKQPIAIPGRPLESRLYLVVHSNNPGIRMPPPISDLEPLNEEEIAKIKVWIAEGALDN